MSMRGRHYFSLVCTFKGYLEFEVEVDVNKSTLSFRERIDYKCVSFIQYMFSSIVVIW